MTDVSSDSRVFLTADEAIAMLSDEEYIHVFINPRPGYVFGSELAKKDVIERIRNGVCELAGELATALEHGLVCSKDDEVIFIKTAKEGE